MLDSFFLSGGFEILFTIVFLLVLGVFIAVLIRSVTQWNRNNQSPRLTVPAVVAAKRLEVRHTGANIQMAGGMASTSYYITFEVKSGDRMELSVSGREYGLLAEGDTGSLTFQGTRYLSFERSGMATTVQTVSVEKEK